jgi:hypothetical protein
MGTNKSRASGDEILQESLPNLVWIEARFYLFFNTLALILPPCQLLLGAYQLLAKDMWAFR